MHMSVCLLQAAVMLAVSPECSAWTQFVNEGDKSFDREGYVWFKQVYDCYKSWTCTKCEETDNRWYDNATLHGAERQYHQRAVCCNCAPGLSSASVVVLFTLLAMVICGCVCFAGLLESKRDPINKNIKETHYTIPADWSCK